MAAKTQPSKPNQPSIKYKHIPLEAASFNLTEYGLEEEAHLKLMSRAANYQKCESKLVDNAFSTTRFLSGVRDVWSYISEPIIDEKHHETDQIEHTFFCSDVTSGTKSKSLASGCFSLKTAVSTIELMKTNQRMPLFDLMEAHKKISSWAGISYVPADLSEMRGSASIGISFDSGSTDGYPRQTPFYNVKGFLYFPRIKGRHLVDTHFSHIASDGNLETGLSYSPHVTNNKDLLSGSTVESVENTDQIMNSLQGSDSPGQVPDIKEQATICKSSNSTLHSNSHMKLVTSIGSGGHKLSSQSFSGVVKGSEVFSNYEHLGAQKYRGWNGLGLEIETSETDCLSAYVKLYNATHNGFAKHGHALAGALAGTFVSLCLHPLDTVKTVIQAHGRDRKSLCQIFAAVVSERGLTGLYRGVGSNIASSAPISAVYTFTYETVKSAFLPLLPHRYHSLVHCTAGGCASIATSFIFTPSERIKQQMQVGTQYQSCWTALLGILKKGGLSSLYTGWGAVLCRNIPHSIIKFYSYEKLKQLMMSSALPNLHPDSLQTLVCGGLAGSTAALFTTPFDVVKTRLQTQIPGSPRQYNSVFHALKEIAQSEGVKGLYRGLTPRLVMYMTQGALFFASYEFFKSVFFLELPRLPSQVVVEEGIKKLKLLGAYAERLRNEPVQIVHCFLPFHMPAADLLINPNRSAWQPMPHPSLSSLEGPDYAMQWKVFLVMTPKVITYSSSAAAGSSTLAVIYLRLYICLPVKDRFY